jgi:hypothetical protein
MLCHFIVMASTELTSVREAIISAEERTFVRNFLISQNRININIIGYQCRPLQVQIKYFQNGHTSGNQRHLCFFKCKGPILISYSATECAQSVSGTCLFIYLFYSCIVYPYTTRRVAGNTTRSTISWCFRATRLE